MENLNEQKITSTPDKKPYDFFDLALKISVFSMLTVTVCGVILCVYGTYKILFG